MGEPYDLMVGDKIEVRLVVKNRELYPKVLTTEGCSAVVKVKPCQVEGFEMVEDTVESIALRWKKCPLSKGPQMFTVSWDRGLGEGILYVAGKTIETEFAVSTDGNKGRVFTFRVEAENS